MPGKRRRLRQFLPLLFLPAIGYQCVAILAALRFRAKSRLRTSNSDTPPVSVLKPVRGLDPNTYAAFASQAEQDYPVFEIVFGVREWDDPVVPQIRKLQAQFPNVDIRLIHATTYAANGKVGILIDLAAQARYPVCVVNDGDIKVGPDYLRAIARPLQDLRVGVVTCPYRAWAHSPAAAWESLGIGSDFMLGVLVADLLGVGFGLGATLAFRKSDLQAAGGFEALTDYLADDYRLGQQIASLGKPAYLCPYIVETALGDATWRGIWQHQIRWARTIRLSNKAGHVGIPIQHAGLWFVLALALGTKWSACVLLAARWCAAAISAVVFENRVVKRWLWLAPVWDLYAFAVWVTSYAGTDVVWRGRRLRLDSSGKIVG